MTPREEMDEQAWFMALRFSELRLLHPTELTVYAARLCCHDQQAGNTSLLASCHVFGQTMLLMPGDTDTSASLQVLFSLLTTLYHALHEFYHTASNCCQHSCTIVPTPWLCVPILHCMMMCVPMQRHQGQHWRNPPLCQQQKQPLQHFARRIKIIANCDLCSCSAVAG